MVEFKDRLRQFRQERELSAAQIAVVFKKSEGAIRMWETGRAKPDADTLIKLAEYFECSTDYLLGLTEYKNTAEHYEHEEVVAETVGRFEKSLGKLDNHVQEELAAVFADTISTLKNLPSHSDIAFHELARITWLIGDVYQRAAKYTVDWDEQNLLLLIGECSAYGKNLGTAMEVILEDYLVEHLQSLTDNSRKQYLQNMLRTFFPQNEKLKSLLEVEN